MQGFKYPLPVHQKGKRELFRKPGNLFPVDGMRFRMRWINQDEEGSLVIFVSPT